MFLSGNWVNTIVHLKMINIYMTDSKCTFGFDCTLKSSCLSYKSKPNFFEQSCFFEQTQIIPCYRFNTVYKAVPFV